MSSSIEHLPSIEVPPVVSPHGPGPVIPYEERLSSNLRWAMDQGDRFFQGRGGAKDALLRIAKRLDEAGIPYAIAGGMALNAHGYRRFTEDVDIIVTQEGLNRIHKELDGRGYLRPFSTSKNLRDTELGVKIEFLITGAFPGDGKPKPYAFPSPFDAGEEIEGIRFVRLPILIELKLASGMTGQGRLKDLGDVQELIKSLKLPRQLGDQLHPYVRSKYDELWSDVDSATVDDESEKRNP